MIDLPAALEVFLVLCAPFIGSFIGCVAHRLPRGIGVVFPPSACPSCDARLRPADLVPIVSWLMLRGRCHACKAPIAIDYPLIEVAAFLVAIGAFAFFSGPMFYASCLLGWVLLALAAIDARHFILPDVLTLPLIPAGLVLSAGLPGLDPADAIIGAAAGGGGLWLIGFLYQRWRGRVGLGLGDVKLLAAGGAWIGWQGLPFALFGGAALALAGVLVAALFGRRIEATTAIPFGTPLAAAIYLVWLIWPRGLP